MADLFEYYNTGDNDKRAVYGAYWAAQTFTPATAHKITSVKLKLYRTGSPGTVTVGIRAVDGSGHPTGADLCSGTTDGDTLPTGSPYEWREITLGAGYDLAASTQYAIVVRGGSSPTNCVNWRYDTSSPTYTGGCREWTSDSGGEWTSDTARDFMFEDWGEPLITPKTSSETGSGADAKKTGEPLATYSRSETGSGAEGLPLRGLWAAQTGSGVDALLSLLGKKVSDSGTGVGNSYLHILEGVKSSSDTGSGADTSTLEALFQRIETALGVESVVSRALYAKEYPAGAIDLANVLTAAITGAETGTGAEASLRAVFQTSSETGSGVDASTLVALFSRDDVGAGAEAITLLAAMLASDSGQSVEMVLSFLKKAIDSGEGSEIVNIIGAVGRAMKLITYLRNYSDLTVYTKPYSDLKVYTQEVKQ